jgi:hypothetical protein
MIMDNDFLTRDEVGWHIYSPDDIFGILLLVGRPDFILGISVRFAVIDDLPVSYAIDSLDLLLFNWSYTREVLFEDGRMVCRNMINN